MLFQWGRSAMVQSGTYTRSGFLSGESGECAEKEGISLGPRERQINRQIFTSLERANVGLFLVV
jgi:hypothetical protein